MSTARRLASREELFARGEARVEVIGGTVVEKAAPSYDHSDAQLGAGSFLRARFHRGGGGGGDAPGGWWIVTGCEIELGPHDLYRPDLVGWRRDRVPQRPEGRCITTRPDWVCEILSASNARADLVDKLRVYQRAQIPHCWIVDPVERVLSLYRNTGHAFEVALTATRGETVHAEPFHQVPFPVGLLFGDDA